MLTPVVPLFFRSLLLAMLTRCAVLCHAVLPGYQAKELKLAKSPTAAATGTSHIQLILLPALLF